MAPGVVTGDTKSASKSSASATPAAPTASGQPRAVGATPRAVVRISARITMPVSTPVPIGAALAIFIWRRSAISSGVSSWLASTPPRAVICSCWRTARSHLAWPCTSIIASWHCGETFVRSTAPASAWLKLRTVVSWLPASPTAPSSSAPPITKTGAPKNQPSASLRVMTSPPALPPSTGGAFDGFSSA